MRVKTGAHKEIPTLAVLARLAEFSLRLGDMHQNYSEQTDATLNTVSVLSILHMLSENVISAIDLIETHIPDGEVEFFESLRVRPSSCVRIMKRMDAGLNPQYRGRIE